MEEAYPREETSIGWWPASTDPGPLFYAYAYPEPEGYAAAAVTPAAAHYDADSGEFVLPYDAIRDDPDPDAAVLAFFRSTYDADAELGGWDRVALEAPIRPADPPRGPWTVLDPVADTPHPVTGAPGER